LQPHSSGHPVQECLAARQASSKPSPDPQRCRRDVGCGGATGRTAADRVVISVSSPTRWAITLGRVCTSLGPGPGFGFERIVSRSPFPSQIDFAIDLVASVPLRIVIPILESAALGGFDGVGREAAAEGFLNKMPQSVKKLNPSAFLS
jgi:hypothetical protein